MQSVEFFNLSRPIQDRLIDSIQGEGVPLLLGSPLQTKTERALQVLGGAIALGAGGLLIPGSGKLESAFALLSEREIAAIACVEAVGLGIALASIRRQGRPARLPFAPGTYLFPAGLFDARTASIRYYPMDSLQQISPTDGGLKLEFANGYSHHFDVEPSLHASKSKAILDSQGLYKKAVASERRRELARISPLVESEYSSPFQEMQPLTFSEPLWGKIWPVLALLVAGILIAPLGYARNHLSEARIFQAAGDADTVQSYKAYLKRGGSRPQVTRVLLPQAELAVAVTAGVHAVEKYISAHPSSEIAGDMERALRTTLLRALNAGKVTGTLAGLDRFEVDHPNHEPVRQELLAARKQIMQATITDFEKIASLWNKKLIPFIKRLVDYSAEHGPDVAIRFRYEQGDSFRQADAQVKLSAYFMGPEAVPSQYFDDKRSIIQETKLAELITTKLNAAFRPEILHFEHGPRADEAAETGPVEVPTLFIHHRVDLSGGFVLHNPRSVFVGAGIVYRTRFRIPGQDEILQFKYSRWRPPDISLMLEEDSPGVVGIYDDIANDAYGTFGTKFLSSILAPVE